MSAPDPAVTENEQNWWDDRTMPNDDGPDWVRDADGTLWQVDSELGVRPGPRSPLRRQRNATTK